MYLQRNKKSKFSVVPCLTSFLCPQVSDRDEIKNCSGPLKEGGKRILWKLEGVFFLSGCFGLRVFFFGGGGGVGLFFILFLPLVNMDLAPPAGSNIKCCFKNPFMERQRKQNL